MPIGGITPPRSFLTIFSSTAPLAWLSLMLIVCRERLPTLRRSLWQLTQYLSTAALASTTGAVAAAAAFVCALAGVASPSPAARNAALKNTTLIQIPLPARRHPLMQTDRRNLLAGLY